MKEKSARIKRIKKPRFLDFHLIPNSSGIILDSIWVKNDNSEMIVVSAFGGQWHFKPLNEGEKSL